MLTVTLGILLARGVTRRINRLSAAINLVARGDLSVRVPVTGSPTRSRTRFSSFARLPHAEFEPADLAAFLRDCAHFARVFSGRAQRLQSA